MLPPRAPFFVVCGGTSRFPHTPSPRSADGGAHMSTDVHPTAIVYPGTVLGEGVKVLEHAVVGKLPSLSPRSTAKREPLPPAEVGDDVVLGRGSLVENDTSIGARTKIQAHAYITAYAILEDDVFIAPCVAT